MGYLICRIEPVGNDTKHRADCEPIVAKLTKQHALRDPKRETVRDLLAKHGFELLARRAGSRIEHQAWPLMVYIYTSRNKEGKGRCGSTLHRWRCRKLEE